MATGRYAIVRTSDTVVVGCCDWNPTTAPNWVPPSGTTAVLLSGQQLTDAVPGSTYNSGTGVFTQPSGQLAYVKAAKQAALDGIFDANFDLSKFIRGGTVTTITGTQVGTFIATITNNYRSLRVSISAAATISAVNAIDITSGWPVNP